ncbi:MAG: transposon-encoded TnpW family protein [Eubacterium sp.]|nr:transposon-encoded TnpW family protein [Eubacterium sp.]
MQLGRTKYIVNVHFDENSKETYADKVKRLIVNDCMKKI